MKTFRRFGFAMLVALCAINFSACSDDDPAEEPPVVPEITVPEGEDNYFNEGLNFSTATNEQELTFTTNTDWTISVAEARNGATWCKVVPNSGKAGTNTVKVITEENPNDEDRNVVLTLNAGNAKKTISVTQKQKDALTVTSSKFEVEAKGGEINIEVKANISFEVEIPDSCKTWISQKTKARGLVTSNLTFVVEETDEATKREGEIIIKGTELSETVKVYQAGQKILLLTQDTYDVDATGDTIQVELKSNFDYEVKMPQVDWIKEVVSARAMSSHTLKYVILANDTYDDRSAEIVFSDKDSNLSNTLKINQSQKKGLIVKENLYSVAADGGKIEVEVNSNVEYDINIDSEWITKVEARSLNKEVLTFDIQANESDQPRNGKITFTDKDKGELAVVEVNQSGKNKGEKRLVSVIYESTDECYRTSQLDSIRYHETYKFTYGEDGKLRSTNGIVKDLFYLNHTEEFNYTYTWEKDKITFTGQNPEDNGSYTLTNGCITQTNMDVDNSTVTARYSYNENKTLKSSEDYGSYSYKWDGLKLTGYDFTNNKDKSTFTMTYQDMNTCKGYNPIISLILISDDSRFSLVSPELFGMKSTYLPTKFKEEYTDSFGTSVTESNLEYTMDAEGYITKCVAIGDYNEAGENEPYQIKEIVTFVWE